MSYGIGKHKGTLSMRLTRAYATMFTVVLLLLSMLIFFITYRFLTKKQMDSIAITMDLTVDRIIEEVHEGEAVDARNLLDEFNTNGNLNMYLRDNAGRTVNRAINFHCDEFALPSAQNAPQIMLSAEKKGRMLLCYEQAVMDEGVKLAQLYIVINLYNEQEYLQLLGVLLIGANLLGGAAALFVGWNTSRRMLAPIDSMISRARSIGSKSLDERLDVPEAEDELKNLSLTINGMLSRIEDAFRQQGRFAADASHELRTPLAVLQGNIDLLERWGYKDKKVLEESIRSIQNQVAYMNRLVENLLFLARTDGNLRELRKESFRVRDLLCELLEEQELLDQAHTYALECQTRLTLAADRSMIKQLLRALIENSVKYTDPGGSISLYAAETKDGKAIALSVTDTGIGMQAENLAHIFERFYRVDKARARETGGMGLGLSIAAAIVQAHGGTISARSEPGKGTSITACFPMT